MNELKTDTERVSWRLFIIFWLILASMSCGKYLSLHTSQADFGRFLNDSFNLSQGQTWRMFYTHISPLMEVWSWPFNFLPHQTIPILLLISQAGALALPVIFLHRQYGWLASLAFTLFFPIWFNALFDFHLDHLIIPLMFGFFFLEHKEKYKFAAILACALALIKAPYALQTMGCGVYFLVRRKPWKEGLFLIVAGLAYFLFATQILQSAYSLGVIQTPLKTDAFSWLGNNPAEMLWTLVTQPHLILAEIFGTPGKRIYLFYLFGALGFISLLRPALLIPALPILGVSLLSKLENHYGLQNHYTAGLIAPLIMSFIGGVPVAKALVGRIGISEKNFIKILVSFLVFIHIWTTPSPISRLFWVDKTWYYHSSAYWPTKRDDFIKKAIVANVPHHLNVVVSVQNSINYGPLAYRKNTLIYPEGVVSPFLDRFGSNSSKANTTVTANQSPSLAVNLTEVWADYVVLDLKRPWFIGDQGCLWNHGKCQNRQDIADRFPALLEQLKNTHDVIFEYDGFMIFKVVDTEIDGP